MLLHELWWARLSEQVFIGPQPSPMQKSWSDIAKGVSFLQSRFMFRPMSSRAFQLLAFRMLGTGHDQAIQAGSRRFSLGLHNY
jgi:hypothetical protein